MSEKKYVGLSGEYKRFHKLLKPLKKIHKDTLHAIHNLFESDDLYPEQVESIKPTEGELHALQKLLNSPLSIIIAGQDNYGKVVVLTKLLGTRLLPFAGQQHTCNTVDSSSFIHNSSLDQVSCSALSDATHDYGARDSTAFPLYLPACEDTKLFNCDMQAQQRIESSSNGKQERPWRGIRISYSSSQVTYSVVRPENVGSSCPCEDDENPITAAQKIPTPSNTPTAILFNSPSEFSEASTQPVVSTTSVQTTARISPFSGRLQGAVVTGQTSNHPASSLPLNEDITIAQLEDLLENKLRTHLEQKQKMEEVDANLIRPENAIKEVPLSEIELSNEHLQDPILRDALLDICLNHCLLKEQVQIIVTPTINKYKCSNVARNKAPGESSLTASSSNKENEAVCTTERVHSERTPKDSPLRSVPLDIPCTNIIPPSPKIEIPKPMKFLHQNKYCSDLVEALIDTQSSVLAFGTPFSSLHPPQFGRSTPSLLSSHSSHESLNSFKSLPIETSMYQTPVASYVVPLPKLVRSSSHPTALDPPGLVPPTVLNGQPFPSSCNPAEIATSREFETKTKSSYKFSAAGMQLPSPISGAVGTIGLPEPSIPNCISPSTGFSGTDEPTTGGLTATCSSASVDSSVEDCKGFMGTLLPNVNAVILYAVTKDHFTPQNIDELQEIRSHTPPCPVIFVRVPPILGALSELPHDQQRRLLIDTGILRPFSDIPADVDQEPSEKRNSCEKPLTGIKVNDENTKGFRDESTEAENAFSVGEREAADCAATIVPVDTPEPMTMDKDVHETKVFVDDVHVLEAPKINEDEVSCNECLTPAGNEADAHPMVFMMDNTPVMGAGPTNDVTKPLKGKTVKFSDNARDNENRIKAGISSKANDLRFGKRDKNCITAGNCCESYTGEEAKKIRKLTSDIYELAERQRDDALSRPNVETSCSQPSDARVGQSSCTVQRPIIKKRSEKNWCKMPAEILRVLNYDLNFLSEDENTASPHVVHCHLMWEDLNISEISRNPFIQSYSRKPHSAVEANLVANLGSFSDILNDSEETETCEENREIACTELCVACGVIESFADFDKLHAWIKLVLRSHVAYTSELLNKIQGRCLSSFVVFAFEFTRQMQVAPRRLEYARQQEEQLYDELLAVARNKEENIRLLIAKTLDQDRDLLLRRVQQMPLEGGSETWEAAVQECVLREVNKRVGQQLVCGVQGLRENCLGTLRRCLAQLEEHCSKERDQASVSFALKKLVNAAYQVEVRPTSSWGLLRSMWERIKELLTGGASAPLDEGASLRRRTAPGSREWKRQIAADMIRGLSEKRLARTIAAQISGEIKAAHSMFLSYMELLETQLNEMNNSIERRKDQLKGVHAPKLAKLALHTDAINNRVKYGLPVLGGELGRGHFGVVYSCKSWAKYSPCAVKTLLPRDSAQWRDIALQYHYTRLMGYHPRIVGIHACLIDKYYGEGNKPVPGRAGGGRERWGSGSRSGAKAHGSKSGALSNQCVLLIMDMHECDLDTAIRRGLLWYQRLRIALDVVLGIRFLHSQGLIHRDIKPKNVLIDVKGRAKVTDLDFCKPEAMMTGSIVGTPIHMAPELFSGNYDSSVDVYAFGVLFWYLCSGKTNMPRNFCLQKSKEDLKVAVFKGVRPECLSTFSPECWAIMEQCWASDPRDRILLGFVEDRLSEMLKKSLDDMKEEDGNSTFLNTTGGSENSDNDSYSSVSDDSE
ncbi:uncharacterized protein LOC108668953 [Hyalella azteca]|uniref:Dual serine/threonine and tyrosine protein kinase n=1 Tax=Hyalella azteca TaxID=294128 RepID=A0A8B7NDN3_HYAAZ|nr:uncharacterized protein LOC108668953 [Hyalella azteca]